MFLKSLARKTIGDVPIAYAIGGKTGALGSWGKLFFVFWDNFWGKWTIVSEISGEKDNWGRTDRLRYWRRNAGAMIIG